MIKFIFVFEENLWRRQLGETVKHAAGASCEPHWHIVTFNADKVVGKL